MQKRFCSENLKGKEQPEDLGVDGKNIRKDLREIEGGKV
jgi:hypothetical protein